MKKEFSLLMICHLVLLVLMIFFSIVFAVLIICDVNLGIFTSYDSLAVAINIVNALAFGCGIVHLWNMYGKRSAIYYQGLLVLSFFGDTLVMALYLSVVSDISVVIIILMSVKLVILLVLAFWKDLGRRNTWILFGSMMAVDLVSGILLSYLIDLIGVAIGMVLSRLTIDATIGLSVHGKYADKEARGRE